jgi:hypothetical protein
MSEHHLVFMSYSHKDRKWLDVFREHLKPLTERGLLTCWSDINISVGGQWQSEIERAIENATIAVLLVTPSFLASDFVARHELPRLLSAVRLKKLAVLWIPISHSLYLQTEIANFQAAHDPARPLDTLRKAQRNKAVVKIAERLVKLVEPQGGIAESPLIPSQAASTCVYDTAAAVAIRPLLMIVYRKDGWHVENKGRGPALNIIVAQKHVSGPERGSWFNPVRIPTLGPNEKRHLVWLGHENYTGLGAGYEDEDGRPFTSVTGNDLTTVHRERLFPRFTEHQIARHWHFASKSTE